MGDGAAFQSSNGCVNHKGLTFRGVPTAAYPILFIRGTQILRGFFTRNLPKTENHTSPSHTTTVSLNAVFTRTSRHDKLLCGGTVF
eukprot:2345107-Amphidinium_carterae.1